MSANEFLKSEPGATWKTIIWIFRLIAIPLWMMAFHKNWGWFVVPLGVTSISFAHTAGFAAFQTLLRPSFRPNQNDGNSAREREIYSIAQAYIDPLIALLVGWIAHSFM